MAKRIGQKVVKRLSSSTLLLAVALLLSCDGTVYNRFVPVENEGWGICDTITYTSEGTAIGNVEPNMGLCVQVRYDASFKYKELWFRTETTDLADSSLVSVDTLCCVVYDDDGCHKGRSAGALYQNESDVVRLPVLSSDTLMIRLSHIMSDSCLVGIRDVGIKLATSSK